MQKSLYQLAGLIALLLVSQFAMAQKIPAVDKSPADIAYFRDGGDVIARVIYSRPQVKGRTVFGGLVKYGKVWRTGANEATEITFYEDVKLGGESVEAGTYTLFTIPGEAEWALILNSELHQWGAYRYKEKNDVLRVKMAPSATDELVEYLSIMFDKDKLIIAWENTMVSIPIEK
jgi:hypothetical protein